jgi:hypothetical protein
MADTQIIWGDSKILTVTHTSSLKLASANRVVTEALQGKTMFAWAKFKRDAFDFDAKLFVEAKRNYIKLKRALLLLSKEGYIEHFTIRSDGRLTVQWFEGAPKQKTIEPIVVKDNSAIADVKPISYEYLRDKFLYYRYRPSLDIKIAQAKLHDRIACTKPWTDGKPYEHKRLGLTADAYHQIEKHNNKIAKLPTNHVEGLPLL